MTGLVTLLKIDNDLGLRLIKIHYFPKSPAAVQAIIAGRHALEFGTGVRQLGIVFY